MSSTAPAMMPPHDTYIETHLGGGAIMKRKPPALRNIGIDLDQRARGRDHHDDEDQRRDDGPDDLDGGAFVKIGGLRSLRLAVHQDRPEHETEHTDEGHHAEDQQGIVQPPLIFSDLRRRDRQVVDRSSQRRDGTQAEAGEDLSSSVAKCVHLVHRDCSRCPGSAASRASCGRVRASRTACRNSLANCRRISGRTNRPTSILRPCPDNSISD